MILIDLPGFRLTGPYPGSDYTVEHYAKFRHAFLDRLGVTRCVLVGNSFGVSHRAATRAEPDCARDLAAARG